MDADEWKGWLARTVREVMAAPEFERYFSVKLNRPRAAMMLTQHGLFSRHRRDCWAYLSANCPVLSIKQKILRHEYEEVIKDDYSDHGHLELVIRQGRAVGMTPEEVLAVEPLPITRACLYAWAWMTREKSWIEGLAALTVTEWSNDDRLLADLGGGPRDAERAALDGGPWTRVEGHAELQSAQPGGRGPRDDVSRRSGEIRDRRARGGGDAGGAGVARSV